MWARKACVLPVRAIAVATGTGILGAAKSFIDAPELITNEVGAGEVHRADHSNTRFHLGTGLRIELCFALAYADVVSVIVQTVSAVEWILLSAPGTVCGHAVKAITNVREWIRYRPQSAGAAMSIAEPQLSLLFEPPPHIGGNLRNLTPVLLRRSLLFRPWRLYS